MWRCRGTLGYMARQPDTNQTRDQYLRVRITPDDRRLIDRLRGSTSTSTFTRRLIRAEAERQGLTT